MKTDFMLIHYIMNDEKLPLKRRLDITKDIKKRVRKIIKAQNESVQYHSTGKDWDAGCWYKEFFTEPFTDEEAEKWIEDHWVRTNCAYDCSGRWFSTRILVFNVNTSFGAKSVVYYFYALDV